MFSLGLDEYYEVVPWDGELDLEDEYFPTKFAGKYLILAFTILNLHSIQFSY